MKQKQQNCRFLQKSNNHLILMRILLLSILMLAAGLTCADVKLPAMFTSNMVIQRNTDVLVWGWASPGEKIRIDASWGTKAETVTGKDGKWMLKLKTGKAGGPFKITVKGENKIELNNVMCGDVWFCSGQSNMQMPMTLWSRDKKLAKKNIANANYPNIRLFSVKFVSSTTPLDDTKGNWKVCTPKNVRNFSAVGYFFGKTLYDNLKVPIGLINCSWGGTIIEAWTPLNDQIHDPAVARLKKRYDKTTKSYNIAKEKAKYAAAKKKYDEWKKGDRKTKASYRPYFKKHPYVDKNYPGNLYNGMIAPTIRFAIKGAIWYQGENNAAKASNYHAQLARMITSWRNAWKCGTFPFYFVQLPNYKAPWKSPVENTNWARMREAFFKTAQKVPNTGMAVTIDIGDAQDIHPANKNDVGDRLARIALYKTYDKENTVWTGPLFKSCKFEGGKAVVKFETGGSPLAVKGDKLKGFALIGKNGIIHKADASILDEDTVIVNAPNVKRAFMLYYAWANNPKGCNLINKAGLPASPFRFGKTPEINLLSRLMPEVEKEYKLVYSLDPVHSKLIKGKKKIAYKIDNSEKLKNVKFTKIAYFMGLMSKKGKVSYALVTIDPFTTDINKIGVPSKSSGARFQEMVKGMTVKSNVKGVKNGKFPEGGNIEFWDCNYGSVNNIGIPRASSKVYDFGDQMKPEVSPGYGCMQIHNWKEKQSVMCFNNFTSSRPDVGIGNWNGRTKDWTFSGSSAKYSCGELKVLIKL